MPCCSAFSGEWKLSPVRSCLNNNTVETSFCFFASVGILGAHRAHTFRYPILATIACTHSCEMPRLVASVYCDMHQFWVIISSALLCWILRSSRYKSTNIILWQHSACYSTLNVKHIVKKCCAHSFTSPAQTVKWYWGGLACVIMRREAKHTN